MQKTWARTFFLLTVLACCSVSYSEDSKGAELSVEEARGLYSFLENIKEQKSLFPEEVNAANLKALLKPEYANGAVLYEKNPAVLNIYDCIFVKVRQNKLIGFETFVQMDPSLSAQDCVAIANDWNNGQSFATVSFNQNEFYIQYFMSFAGGIHADNFNDTIEWVLASSFYFENYLQSIVEQK